MNNRKKNNRNILSIGTLIILFVVPAFLFQCKKDTLPVNGDPEKFAYLTEDYPPFNYLENGITNGVSADILEDLFSRLNLTINRSAITNENWATAYETVLNTPETMLFSAVKTAERDTLFKWVGPIAPHSEVALALTSSGIVIKQVSEINNYFIGVVKDYSSIDVLLDQGIYRTNIVIYDTPAELYKALVESMEVQLISYSKAGHALMIQSLNYSPASFSLPFTIHSDELYYAFNRETDDAMIADFQSHLDKLKTDKSADGSSDYEKILNRYSVIQHINDGITDEMVITLVNQTATDLAADDIGTVSKMNQGLHPYKDKNNPALYSFAYNTDVVMVAHATNTSLVGTSFVGKPDVAGKNFRDEIVQGALANGTGWVDYIYTKTDQSGLYYKTTYYKLVTGSSSKVYIVCAGKFK
jgi:polar amino acid transport system substrate-binding protein